MKNYPAQSLKILQVLLIFLSPGFLSSVQGNNIQSTHSPEALREFQYDHPVARKLALSFFESYIDYSKGELEAQEITLVYSSEKEAVSPMYIYQNTSGGFVCIAVSGERAKIMGYSDEGIFDMFAIPVQLKGLIDYYESTVSDFSVKSTGSAKGTVVVSPLLDIEGVSLNQYYHTERGIECPTGCVATAMTQIMAYYKFPDHGFGSHCYYHSVYGTQCADFENTVFDWNNMTDDAYRLLSYQMGVAMEMDYCGGKGGSAPDSPYYGEVLEEYYGYFVRSGTKDLYYIYNELDNERPVYAEIPGAVGHAVVLDGYDSDGMVHINFGWGGNANGYFTLNNGGLINAGTPGSGYVFGSNLALTRYISRSILPTAEEDSLALLSIHESLGGTTGWDITKPVMKWPGVMVMNGRVTELLLGNISGTISPELGVLTSLRRLNLRGSLDGTLPASVTSLQSLTELRVISGEGSLKVTLPQEIGDLTNLEILDMNQSAEGTIPASIGNLSKLRILNFYNCSLTGEIPAELWNLGSLQSINLSNNDLTGTIPDAIETMGNLITLDLSYNNLTGSLPGTLNNLVHLQYLLLQGNQLSGVLPDDIAAWTKMVHAELQNNLLEGAVPSGIGNMVQLKYLDLSNNSFTSLPNEIGRLHLLTGMDISNNQFTTLPDSIIHLTGLVNFDASNNQIGKLPLNFGGWPELQEIDLEHNMIPEFPGELCSLTNLWRIDIGNNLIKKFPAAIHLIKGVSEVHLDSNLVHDAVPVSMLTGSERIFDLRHNHLQYSDIKDSDNYLSGVGLQRTVPLTENMMKVRQGDTVKIDIRELTGLSAPGNSYFWLEYPEKLVSAYIEELQDYTEGPLLEVVADASLLTKKYYCKVFNEESAEYSWEWMGNNYISPVLRNLTTDTLSFAFMSEDEILQNQYLGRGLVASSELPGGEVSNGEVILATPFDLRGDIIWEGSVNGQEWIDLSLASVSEDPGRNVVSMSDSALVLSPLSPAYYRCILKEGDCDPLVSDVVKVNPLGELLYDDLVNVTGGDVTVEVDSISVTLPQGLSEEEFRLTIVKVDNPPAAEGAVSRGSVYDVSLSLGTVFENPLVVKLKNFEMEGMDMRNVPALKPAWYDEVNQQWIAYEEGGINLLDSTIEFKTTHLTKLSWYQLQHGSYTHIYTRDKVDVIYKWGTGTGEENNYLGYQYAIKGYPTESWHSSNTDVDAGGTPAVVLDIAEYMNQIIDKFISLGLQYSGSKFTVYISNTGNYSMGHIGVGGYSKGYFTLNSSKTFFPEELRQTLAHEYMHYTQAYYMDVLTGNYFWAEATAPLSDRIVWGTDAHEVAEPEANLSQAYVRQADDRSIFDLLGSSWDDFTSLPLVDKFATNPADANVSSTLLHYMRSYRSGSKLNPVTLLKNQLSLGGLTSITWRSYLNSQVADQLESTLGEEYDDYVRYLLSGVNASFTALNLKQGNPFSYMIDNAGSENKGTFTQQMVYNFAPEQTEPQVDALSLSVPYLGSKVVMLNNITSERAVVVSYERNHELSAEFEVYHGYYDHKQKEVLFRNISDSLKYSIFLDALTDKAAKEYQNLSFLLFVNKKCPSVISIGNTFSPDFQITAMPVLNIDDIAYLNVSSNPIHSYSDDLNRMFYIDGRQDKYIPGMESLFLVSDYERTKSMKGDSSYVVNVSFNEELTVDNGPDLPSTINSYHKIQTIEYNFISGEITIRQISTGTSKYGAYCTLITDECFEEIVSGVRYDSQELKLRNFTEFESENIEMLGDVMVFTTANTADTQSAVSGISHELSYTNYYTNGEVSSSGAANYVSTDYSGEVEILIYFHYK